MNSIRAREKASVSGWLVGRLVVPLVTRKRLGQPSLRERIARDRKAGPAMPPRRLRARHSFQDARLGGQRVLRFGPRDGGTLPLLFYIHGGAYVFGLMALHWTIAAQLVARTGSGLVLPLYPLAPEHEVDAGLAGVERAYLALVAEIGAQNVVLMGDSAGGGLALALVHRLRETGRDLPRGIVLLYPWLDATLCDPSQPALERRDPVLSIAELREAGRLWAGREGPAGEKASPLFADQTGLPPVLVLVGTHDLLLADARRFAERSPAARIVEYPGMFHGFLSAPVPEARDAFERIARFVGDHGGAVS